MGCSSSKTVAAEPFPPSDVQKEEVTTPQARPRQARLSLAGNFDQFESFKKPKGVANDHSGNGCIYSPRSDAPHITYAFISQKGHYPDQPFKANQDAVTVIEDFSDDPLSSLMIVFDGHGETGAQCAHFAKSKLPAALSSNPHLQSNPQKALKESMLLTNADLHKSPIDDTLSGTTACAALFKGNTVCVANVGDSRAVLAVKKPDSNKLIAVDLSSDQTPFREDECSRVKRAGARVLTLDQIEGLKDASVPCWTNEENCDGDPPRLWASDGIYPGTAFTRSIGDSVAESIGVTAEPEIITTMLTREHPFLVVASDGVWEFLSSQTVVEIVAESRTPDAAAKALVDAAYKAWLTKEMRTDDISVVVVFMNYDFDAVNEDSSD